MTKKEDHTTRLAEIADTSFGELSDEEVLRLLAERKQLQDLKAQYEKLQQEQVVLAQAEAERADIEKELARLNTLITPDKPDDELIHLIEERKTWEAKLAAADENVVHLGGQAKPKEPVAETPSKEAAAPVKVPVEEVPEKTLPKEEAHLKTEMKPEEISVSSAEEKKALGISEDESFGGEAIKQTTFADNDEFSHYLDDIRHATGSLGKILEGLPANAKKDKAFMLEVAKVDPAYAMHYADPGTLKKDEDFNIKVASMKNARNSGSVLAEVLPEARTAKVVMAGIRADYRNVRFALPQMEGYDDMLSRAKSGALEKVKELKESVDVGLLIPKILQKDKEFMTQVEKAAVPKEEKQ